MAPPARHRDEGRETLRSGDPKMGIRAPGADSNYSGGIQGVTSRGLASVENANSVTEWNVSPGRNTVEGNIGLLGLSG